MSHLLREAGALLDEFLVKLGLEDGELAEDGVKLVIVTVVKINQGAPIPGRGSIDPLLPQNGFSWGHCLAICLRSILCLGSTFHPIIQSLKE